MPPHKFEFEAISTTEGPFEALNNGLHTLSLRHALKLVVKSLVAATNSSCAMIDTGYL